MDKIIIGMGIFIFLFFLIQSLRTNSPVRNALLCMIGGVVSLAAANMLGFFISINLFTVMVSLTLGLPGVALMVIVTKFL